VHPHPGPLPAPLLGAPVGVGEVDEGLPGEQRPPHERHRPLDPRLVLRAAHPRRVDREAARLGVLHERLVQPRLGRVGALHDGFEVVGDHRGEHPAVERPRRLEPRDHIIQCLTVGQPHEAEP